MNPLARLLIRMSYPPSLLLNRMMCVLGVWNPWDWIDDRVLLGAVPSRRRLVELHDLGIRGIVNLCEEFGGYHDEMERLGITQLHLPTFDYTSPSEESLRCGVRFLLDAAEAGRKSFVHCKAGQGRSATLALCYLMAARGWSAEEAMTRLRAARPNVNRRIHRREVVRRFERASCRTDDTAPAERRRVMASETHRL